MAVWLTLCAGLALARAQQQSVNPGNSPAAKPRITNARLQELQATSGLRATVDGLAQKQPGPLWIGYRIPAAGKERTLCCFNSVDSMNWQKSNCCMGCRVESGKGGSG